MPLDKGGREPVDTLVKRLRLTAAFNHESDGATGDGALLDEAADEIERLRARVAELEAEANAAADIIASDPDRMKLIDAAIESGLERAAKYVEENDTDSLAAAIRSLKETPNASR